MSEEEKAAELTPAQSRALRQAAAHPSVSDVSEPVALDRGGLLFRVTVRNELPAKWRGDGASPFGVRAQETAIIILPQRYPLSSPLIYLREDFPRHHPHILPQKEGSSVRPCLSMAPPREVVQGRGFIGLIEQLVDWFERAANLDLNDPRLGWEPVRRDSIDDVIAAGSEIVRRRCDANGGFSFSLATYGFYKSSDIIRMLVRGETIKLTDYVSTLIKHDGGKDPIGAGLCVTAWPGSHDGVPITCPLYLPETVSTLLELFERADLYGCGVEIRAAVASVSELLSNHPTEDAFPFGVLLLVRRPFNLVGEASSIEIAPYTVVMPRDGVLASDAPVRLAAHRDTANPALLRRTSGDDPMQQTLPWSLIGVGSVGSKIALHAARAGRAPSVVVDPSYLSTHNFARHAALPSGSVDSLFLKYKADVCQEQIRQLGQTAESICEDAVFLSGDQQGLARLSPDGTKMIVNATASLVAREALSYASWNDRPSIIETCLLGSGRLAYFACEGTDGNPNLSDLAAETYRILAQDSALAKAAFTAEQEEVTIGQGCSAVTFPMPDAHVSLISAAFAQQVTRLARDVEPASASISIGVVEDDGSLNWQTYESEAWIEVDMADNGPSVRIHPRVHQLIEEEVAKHPDEETGGVLVGRFSNVGNAFQIVDLIEAPPDSQRSAGEFLLGTQGLKAAALDIATRTGGALQVVGTWHSHLHPSGPSKTDAIAGAVLAMRQFVPALLLIHTPAGYELLVAEQNY